MSDTKFVDDYKAIMAVIHKYNEGCARGDSSIMRSSFADGANIFGQKDGQLTGGPIQELFDAIDALDASPEVKAVVARVDIVGTAASARIDTDGLAGSRYTDFFNLVKASGQWTIVSKVWNSNPTN